MMHTNTKSFEVTTRGKGTYEITDQVREIVGESKIKTGTVTIFARHTSCSLIIMENAAPAARRDLEKIFRTACPGGCKLRTR